MALIRGVDVSRYQTVSSWPGVDRDVDFTIIKCTEGTGAVSDTFQKYWAGAKGDVLRGTYHYGHPKNSALTEARHYVAVLKLAGWKSGVDLPPVLDIEITEGKGYAALTTWVLDFVQEVDKLLGLTDPWLKCGVYTNNNYRKNLFDGAKVLNGRWLWLANWPNRDGPWPDEASRDKYATGAAIWQWTDRVHITGITSQDADGNVARLSDLQHLAPKYYNVAEPTVEEDVALTATDAKTVWGTPVIPNRNDPNEPASGNATPGGMLSNIEATQDVDHARLAQVEKDVADVKATVTAASVHALQEIAALKAALPGLISEALASGVVKVEVTVNGAS